MTGKCFRTSRPVRLGPYEHFPSWYRKALAVKRKATLKQNRSYFGKKTSTTKSNSDIRRVNFGQKIAQKVQHKFDSFSHFPRGKPEQNRKETKVLDKDRANKLNSSQDGFLFSKPLIGSAKKSVLEFAENLQRIKEKLWHTVQSTNPILKTVKSSYSTLKLAKNIILGVPNYMRSNSFDIHTTAYHHPVTLAPTKKEKWVPRIAVILLYFACITGNGSQAWGQQQCLSILGKCAIMRQEMRLWHLAISHKGMG